MIWLFLGWWSGWTGWPGWLLTSVMTWETWLCPGQVPGLGSHRRRLTHLLQLRMGLAAFILIFEKLCKACVCDCDTCGFQARVSVKCGELSWGALNLISP